MESFPSPKQVIESSRRKLIDDPAKLRQEVRQNMAGMHPSDRWVSVRGGDYTDEVRNLVIQELARSGWQVEYHGYWLDIYPASAV